MSKVSMNFWRTEFACRCGCGFSAVDVELLTVLEDLRVELLSGHPEYPGIEILSGCRCQEHNKKVGGAPKSKHVQGIAADIRVWLYWQRLQLAPAAVADFLEDRYSDRYGIGRYSTFTHVDVRQQQTRWIG